MRNNKTAIAEFVSSQRRERVQLFTCLPHLHVPTGLNSFVLFLLFGGGLVSWFILLLKGERQPYSQR